MCVEAARLAEGAPALERFAASDLLSVAQSYELAPTRDLTSARDYYQRAATRWRTSDRGMYAVALEGAARTALDAGDAAAAIVDFRASAKAALDLGTPGQDQVVFSRYGLGRALIASGAIADGVAELEWALPRLESQTTPSHLTIASARISLAEGVWQRNTGADRARARLLAMTATDEIAAQRATLANSGPLEPSYRAAVDRVEARLRGWLAAHR